ncbi:MAG: methyltransferase domain-containing protein [Planctomycetaceae bacterium]|nr:methyltransferase domain-containing protein [Planctomycetaceae bacterium]
MFCRYFRDNLCRSCSLLNSTLSDSLRQKEQSLQALFPDVDCIQPVRSSGTAEGSRIRAKLAIAGTADAPLVGFPGANGTHVPVDDCPLHHPLIRRFTEQLPQLIRDYRLTPFDVATNRGELKFVLVTCSPTHQQLMVQWIVRSRECIDRLKKLWQHKDPSLNLTVMCASLQPLRTSLMQGTDDTWLSDVKHLPVTYGQRTVLYSPHSFIQTNYFAALDLYSTAADVLKHHNSQSLLDLYCGVGAFSLSCCEPHMKCVGIEINESSVACAQEAARLNELPLLTFIPYDATASKTSLAQATGIQCEAWDAVICNPPRRGLDSSVVDLLQDLQPKLILYSSCNPQTLARDFRLLPGYRIERLSPFDMFPFTTHMEVLCVLTRR